MSKIKTCIKSRWGDDGVIIEADFKQLEVFGLAFLSGDPQLKKDLLDGLDMHCLSASFLFNTDYDIIKKAVDDGDPVWEKKRKIAKGPGFLIQYGGGAETMAEGTDLSVDDCKNFIDKYYERYHVVKTWQMSNIRQVKLSRKPSVEKTFKGYPAGVGTLTSITGRIYKFTETDAPDYAAARGNKTSFLPTKIKNYPVQGFATGDIVPEVCGRMFRALKADKFLRTQFLMINTVHDSLLFDAHLDVSEHGLLKVKEVMEKAPMWMKARFGINIDMPLNVDIKIGPTWGELIPVNFNPA